MANGVSHCKLLKKVFPPLQQRVMAFPVLLSAGGLGDPTLVSRPCFSGAGFFLPFCSLSEVLGISLSDSQVLDSQKVNLFFLFPLKV